MSYVDTERALRQKVRSAQKEATEARKEVDDLKLELSQKSTALSQYEKYYADAKKLESTTDDLLKAAAMKLDNAQKQASKSRNEAIELQSKLAIVTMAKEELMMKNDELTLKHEAATEILADERVEHAMEIVKIRGKRDEDIDKLLADLNEFESDLALFKTTKLEESRVLEEKYQAKIKELEANFGLERKDSASRKNILLKKMTECEQELRDFKSSSSIKLEEDRKVAGNAANKILELSQKIKLKDKKLDGLWQEVQRQKSLHPTIEHKRCQELAYLRSEVKHLNSKLRIQPQQHLHHNRLNYVRPLPQFQYLPLQADAPNWKPREAPAPVPSNNKPHELPVSTPARSKQVISRPTVLKGKTNTVANVLPPPGFNAVPMVHMVHSFRNRKQAPPSLPSPQQAKRAKLETDQSPPQAEQVQILKIMNSVSPSNVKDLACKLEKLLPDGHRKWFANYFVSNFVMSQRNNHKVYSELIRNAIKSGAESLQTSVETISCDKVNELVGSNENGEKVKTMGSWYANFSLTPNSFCEIILIGGIRNGENDMRIRFVEGVLSVVCEKNRNKFDSFTKTLELLKTIHGMPSTSDRTKIRIEAAVKIWEQKLAPFLLLLQEINDGRKITNCIIHVLNLRHSWHSLYFISKVNISS